MGQDYWSNARTGTHGRIVIPNFVSKFNINNFTKINSISHLLYRLIFGTAEFHIHRNRACIDCNSNLSIDHAVTHCALFNAERDRIRLGLQRLNKQPTLENILDPNIHISIREDRNNLIKKYMKNLPFEK